MRRVGVLGAVVVASCFAIAVTMSCGNFGGSDPNGATSDSASPTDAESNDASATDANAADAATNTSCSSITSTSICDSFDSLDGGFAAFWSMVATADGTLARSSNQELTAPYSILTIVPDEPDASNERFQDLQAVINFQPHVVIDLDFYVSFNGSEPDPFAEIVDLAFDSQTIQTARIVIAENDVHADVNTFVGDDRTNTFVSSGSPSDSVVNYHDQWHHAHVDIKFGAALTGSVSLSIGAVNFATQLNQTTLPTTSPQTLNVRVGDSPGSGGSNVYIDNFAINATPN